MNDETMQRMALLKTARQQLNNQYIQDRATAFTQWSADSDRAWRENGIKLPFPPPPPAPSENDIIAYALALYNAQNTQNIQASPPAVVQPVPVAPVTAPQAEGTIETLSQPSVNTNDLPSVSIVPTIQVETTTTSINPVIANIVPEQVIEPEIIQTTVSPATTENLSANEIAIKEIFSAPTADPITLTSGTPSTSVLPLIKSMLKKGLLPSWVKPDDAGIKE